MSKRGFHPSAWVVWLLAAAVTVLLIRNPFYLLILLLAALLARDSAAGRDGDFELPLACISLAILLFATLFNAISVHVGETVLLTLPPQWPLIGGEVTLEAAVYGAVSGLVLITLLVIFDAFNRLVPAGDLVRLTPPALRDLGLITLIALTYVPEATKQLQRVREAQAIRGHRMKGLSDWRPLLVPLLIGSLERAMDLAESMVARGFGSAGTQAHSTRFTFWLAASLLLALAGWAALLESVWLGWALLLGSALVIAGLLWRLGRGRSRTRYRPRPWHRLDVFLVTSAVAGLLILIAPWPALNRSTLHYSPYPALSWPGVAPIWLLALAVLAAPVLLRRMAASP
ncbi:MAG: energy-coupling factor transporter transmembrane component T [Anaerolineae bacterium]